MKDILSVLAFRNSELSPEARMFLVRWAQGFGGSEKVLGGYDELRRGLGLSARAISKAMKSLKTLNLIQIEETREVKVGRPKSTYRCDFSDFGDPESEGLTWKPCLDSFLFASSVNFNQGRSKQLTSSNRLLLSVLLLKADPCGKVKGLGRSDLAALTGMSSERVKSQLNKLARLGYIQGCLPGGTGSYLMGSVTGVYWLNMQKLDAVDEGVDWKNISIALNLSVYDLSGVVHEYAKYGEDVLDLESGSGVENGTIGAASDRRYIISDVKKSGVSRFFSDSLGTRVIELFQAELEDLACQAVEEKLVGGWGDWPQSCPEELRSTYESSFSCGNPKAESMGDKQRARLLDMLVEYVYRLSLIVADEILRYLKKKKLIELWSEDSRLTLIPVRGIKAQERWLYVCKISNQ